MTELRDLVLGVRQAYARGENAMEFVRRHTDSEANSTLGTLLAYDLQAGSYVEAVRNRTFDNERWCAQIAQVLAPHLQSQASILEVGCGEATTLQGVLAALAPVSPSGWGLDISWSRCATGLQWLKQNNSTAQLFVADLFNIPLADDSIDIVYTSHSLEPNGGREAAAIRELMRVARTAVVLVEPIYELAAAASQERMRKHGYVRGLKGVAESLGGLVTQYRLLDYLPQPTNPSGLVVIDKTHTASTRGARPQSSWRCPLTYVPLRAADQAFVAEESGLIYPVLKQIPMLRVEHAIIASKFLEHSGRAGDE